MYWPCHQVKKITLSPSINYLILFNSAIIYQAPIINSKNTDSKSDKKNEKK